MLTEVCGPQSAGLGFSKEGGGGSRGGRGEGKSHLQHQAHRLCPRAAVQPWPVMPALGWFPHLENEKKKNNACLTMLSYGLNEIK